MQKPNNYENVQASGEFTPLELGGHKLVVKQVEEKKSSTGKDMIVVYFDTASNDKQPNYFMDMFKNDIRPDKKWPNQATAYILTEDKDGNCSRNFKTFTTCVEHSNAGFSVQWGDKFCEYFKNRNVGGVFGIVEEEYNGERKKKRKLRWFVSSDKADQADIPEERLLPENTMPAPESDGFMNMQDDLDEELPFN